MELLVKIVKYFSLNIFLNPLSKMCDGALNALLTSINELFYTSKRAVSHLFGKLALNTQPAFTCCKSAATETLEQVVKFLKTLYC